MGPFQPPSVLDKNRKHLYKNLAKLLAPVHNKEKEAVFKLLVKIEGDPLNTQHAQQEEEVVVFAGEEVRGRLHL